MGRTYTIRGGSIPGKKRGGQDMEMTAKGLVRGRLLLEADDGGVRYCARAQACGALWGDRVLARCVGEDGAAVRRVLLRAHETMLGVLGVGERKAAFDPLERRLPRWLRVDGSPQEVLEETGARDGDIVRARVVRWENEGGLLVRVEARIGSLSRSADALDALVQSEDLPRGFSPDAAAQAKACKSASLADDPEREDLRALCLFTIDGRDAKDFDDAVSLTADADGGALLGVHIADVGCYVPQGSPLDREAYLRGTSVYLPGRVLPMLPEELSNGVCSLRPGEDKFALSAFMRVSPSGEVRSLRLARSVIRSRARLVYDDVNAMLSGDEEQTARMEALGVRGTLLAMCDAARRIRRRREARGCVDFELDEPVFELDADGEPVSIALRARGEAERMIEDFMLAANEAVAKMARERGLPLLYRVHEKPDPEKLADFSDMLSRLGVSAKGLDANAGPGELRAVLERTRDRQEYPVIATLALRSMQKARYDPKPLGHYGLALDDYCHFTSPIRRYPDLVVSRALTAMLRGGRATLTGEALEDAARRSSARERIAADVERKADKLMAVRYMAGHVGETYDGTISGVAEYGFYVALGNGAEGVVYASALGDWFEADDRRMTLRGERTGVTFTLGQALRVRVTEVELAAGVVKLELCDMPPGAPRREEPPKRGGKKAGKRRTRRKRR